MVVAVFLYFFQNDLKRLLALSTTSQLSYIILGTGLGWVRWARRLLIAVRCST